MSETDAYTFYDPLFYEAKVWEEDDYYEDLDGNLTQSAHADISQTSLHQASKSAQKMCKRKNTIDCYERIVELINDWCQEQAIITSDGRYKSCVESPNAISSTALELYIAKKCCLEGRRHCTGRQAQSSLAWKWDHIPGGTYSGKNYVLDEKTGHVTGNPARSVPIRDMLRGLEVRDRESAEHQAEPVTGDQMYAMYKASCALVSDEEVHELTANPGKNSGRLPTVLREIIKRAYVVFGFVSMGRHHDVSNLKATNIHRQETAAGTPHFKAQFEVRKSRADKTTVRRIYIFYKYHLPHLDAVTPIILMMSLLESVLGRKLHAGDVLFPFVSTTGIPQMTRPISKDVAMRMMGEYAAQAGISIRFTTHSLRRGGAQYFFIDAPLGWRWSLHAIHWWASWTGDDVKMLITYLLNDLWKREKDFGNQLDPSKWPEQYGGVTDTSLRGEAAYGKAATVQDLDTLGSKIFGLLEKVVNKSDDLGEKVAGVEARMTCSGHTSSADHYGRHNLAGSDPLPGHGGGYWQQGPAYRPRIEYPHPPIVDSTGPSHHGSPTAVSTSYIHSQPGPQLLGGIFNGLVPPRGHYTPPQGPPLGTSSTNVPEPLVKKPFRPRPPLSDRGVNGPANNGPSASIQHGQTMGGYGNLADQASSSLVPWAKPLPDAVIAACRRGHLSIPDLIGTHSERFWKAIFQWLIIDPETGYALKDWNPEWLTIHKNTFAIKYRLRKVIGLEFESLGYAKFMESYPDAEEVAIEDLVAIIEARQGKQKWKRTSKNGTPAEREAAAKAKVSATMATGVGPRDIAHRWSLRLPSPAIAQSPRDSRSRRTLIRHQAEELDTPPAAVGYNRGVDSRGFIISRPGETAVSPSPAMGIPNLWPMLAPVAIETSIQRLAVNDGFSSNHSGARALRVGIDASTFIHDARNNHDGIGGNPELDRLFTRCARLLTLPLLPLFVFVGSYQDSKRVDRSPRWLVAAFKELLTCLAISWVDVAPGDAEAELAFMSKSNQLDVVMAQDSNIVLFGARVMLRMCTRDGEERIMMYQAVDIERHLQLQLQAPDLLVVALLAGGDHSSSICPIRLAVELAHTGLGRALVKGLRRAHGNASTQRFLRRWRQTLVEELRHNASGCLSRRHPIMAQSIPINFPSIAVISAYRDPLRTQLSEANPGAPLAPARSLDLSRLARFVDTYLAAGDPDGMYRLFCTHVFPGVAMQQLMNAALSTDAGLGHRVCPIIGMVIGLRREPDAPRLHVPELRLDLNVDLSILNSVFDGRRGGNLDLADLTGISDLPPYTFDFDWEGEADRAERDEDYILWGFEGLSLALHPETSRSTQSLMKSMITWRAGRMSLSCEPQKEDGGPGDVSGLERFVSGLCG
ncbi:hypothetical protein DXG01_005913 [Tephrocybe rancida]|nr:hypothetical protein DXG01_005913 [Tephrocybe rancida]